MSRYTTCGCTDGRHHDPMAKKRCHAIRMDAKVIAFHTARHVIREAEIGLGIALPEGWRPTRMTGGSGTTTHGWIAVAPGCPTKRHPTRDCRCKAARSYAEAVDYAVKAAA